MNPLRYAETTMTPEEAEAIVRRLAHEASDGPNVIELAAALRVSPEKVATTLAEVRAARKPKRKRRVMRRERRLWLLTGLAALFIAGTGVVAAGSLGVRPFSTRPQVRGVQGQGAYALFFNGVPSGWGLSVGDDPKRILNDRFDGWIERNMPQFPTRAVPPESEAAYRRAIRSGTWDLDHGMTAVVLEVRKGTPSGRWLRWAVTTVPCYDGDDALILDGVRQERDRRMRAAIETAIKGLGSTAR